MLLEQINNLAAHRPELHAPAAVVAAWYEEKAAMLEALARLAHGTEAEWNRANAALARRHAERLLHPEKG